MSIPEPAVGCDYIMIHFYLSRGIKHQIGSPGIGLIFECNDFGVQIFCNNVNLDAYKIKSNVAQQEAKEQLSALKPLIAIWINAVIFEGISKMIRFPDPHSLQTKTSISSILIAIAILGYLDLEARPYRARKLRAGAFEA